MLFEGNFRGADYMAERRLTIKYWLCVLDRLVPSLQTHTVGDTNSTGGHA